MPQPLPDADADTDADVDVRPGPPSWQGALWLIAGLMLVATLHLGRDIFAPLALALLLGLLLDPLVTRLRRWGLARGAAVGLVLLLTAASLGAASVFVGSQVVQLSKDLPSYQSTIQGKLRAFRQALVERQARDGTTRLLALVDGEIDATRRAIDKASQRPPAPLARVQVEPPPRSAVQAATDLVTPLLAPLGTAAIVLVLVICVLLERHELRDRLLRLSGGHLRLGTEALDEAADRVSRYLRMQLLVNLSHGVPMAAGLALIGIPGALLWGVVAGLLRFVPYVGPAVAAIFPLVLAFAVDPGWQMLLWVAALVLTLELVSNHLVEPWLYGASTGLSPLSLILSAVFWTALWGPVGLVLATPLTVCLSVLGRHVHGLRWLDTLLGSEPAFDPPTRLYQRLLAGDVEEAIDLANGQVAEGGPGAFYSDCAVPALQLAAHDHRLAASPEHRRRISTGLQAVLKELQSDHPAPPAKPGTPVVLCIGARGELDTLSARMLAHALALAGVDARALPNGAVGADRVNDLDLSGVDRVCLAYFSPSPEAHLRHVVRRLRRRRPDLPIAAALWQAPQALRAPGAAAQLGVDAVAQTLAQATACLQVAVPPDPPAPSNAMGNGLTNGLAGGLAGAGQARPV